MSSTSRREIRRPRNSRSWVELSLPTGGGKVAVMEAESLRAAVRSRPWQAGGKSSSLGSFGLLLGELLAGAPSSAPASFTGMAREQR
jgi:hypothetical protein